MTTLKIETVEQEQPVLVLHQGWISGDDGEGLTFDLTCGAGLGNAYVKLAVEKDGKTVHEFFDMTVVVEDWVRVVAERMDADV